MSVMEVKEAQMSPRARAGTVTRPETEAEDNLTLQDSTQDPERRDPIRPPSPPRPGPNAPPPTATTAVRRELAHYASLVLASMIGCLIRLGLEALTRYDGQIIFELAWAQGVGCGIMGLALSRKNDITDFYPPLYTFFTTGMAGSVTTFSSWMLEGYEAFANFGRYNRSGLYDAVDGFGYSFATFAISIGCLYWGEHVGACLPSSATLTVADQKQDPESPDPYAKFTRRSYIITDYIVISTALISYLIALLLYFLGPATWQHRATFPILLSPPGAILRLALSSINTRRPFLNRFPLGTFLANIAGTLMIGGVFAAQHLDTARMLQIRCNALYAVQQGFCGCLTTVSTFVVEVRAIRGKRWKWMYVGSSVILGHLAVLVTLGAVGWSQGLGPMCTE